MGVGWGEVFEGGVGEGGGMKPLSGGAVFDFELGVGS